MTALCSFGVQNKSWPFGLATRSETLVRGDLLPARFPLWLRPFLSIVAWQHLSQGHLGDSTQTFEATIFFGDMVNSSTLLTQYSLSTVVRLLNRFFTLMEEVIHGHQGFTEKLLGDGLLGVFHDAQAALRAAQATQQALADFNTARGDRPLLARIALDSGPIVITSLGGPWRMDHTVVGVPVNAASHLLRLARPGEIWFTQATRDRLGETDLVAEARSVELKGYAAPQTVYRLVRGPDRMLPAGLCLRR